MYLICYRRGQTTLPDNMGVMLIDEMDANIALTVGLNQLRSNGEVKEFRLISQEKLQIVGSHTRELSIGAIVYPVIEVKKIDGISPVKSIIRLAVERAFAFYNGNQTKAAKALGMSRNTLRHHLGLAKYPYE